MDGQLNQNDTTMFWEASGGLLHSTGGGCSTSISCSGGPGVGVAANRRRKKRPSYGVRTVDITKGKNGFGFTISGQAPCMLSYIVPGSSAERSGLRIGDYLIAVNGQNVSKSPHDNVVRIIGLSKLLKLQIAENYYSDSSDDEFLSNRHKPKFPNRLRHKQQQTRAERVVRDLQSGAIFSERAAIQLGEAALLSDRDWPDSFPGKSPLSGSYSAKSSMSPTSGVSSPPLPELLNGGAPPQCSSPTRRRFVPPLVFPPDARQSVSHTPTHQFDDALDHLTRSRQSPVKLEKLLNKNKLLTMQQQQFQQHEHQIQHLKQNQQLIQQQHNHHQLRPSLQSHQYQQCHSHQQMSSFSSKPQNAMSQLQQHNHHQQQQQQEQSNNLQQNNEQQNQTSLNSQQQSHQSHQLLQQHQQHLLDNEKFHQQQQQHLLEQQYHQQILQRHNHQVQKPTTSAFNDVRIITEQEINQILYPTLAELQMHGPPPDLGESLYRAVVGYLGTIEVPKDSQGGTRLTAIKNCIRRLRIEKKVHTLVLMSVFTERVVLTNPHGITLAQYPAERITFCGVYADDKKFFGLVTVHGCVSDEFSDVSQDGRGNDRIEQSISSSCHVFMVDPIMVQHTDHSRRAKTFRIDCTPAGDDSPLTHCKEFPESADPILNTIMSLYRSQPGFNFDNGANNAGLADDAQMSPQHSNTSSNSSNSDSGIGFRDEGGSHLYRHVERVFVVEVDDNQRMRIQNYHLVGGRNNNNNNNNNGSNNSNGANNNASTNATFRTNNHLENMQANLDNLRCNINYNMPGASGGMNGSLGNHLLLGESSDCVNISVNSNTNPRTNSAERNPSSSSKGDFRAMNTGDRLRVNKCDPKYTKAVLNDSIATLPNENLRVSVTDNNSCDRDSLVVNCALDDEKDFDSLTSQIQGSNMTDYLKAGLSDSNSKRRRRSESRVGTSDGIILDGRSSITDELRAALLIAGRGENRSSLAAAVDGRESVTEEKRYRLSGNRTPATECNSPSDIGRLTVRAMPDPIGIERTIISPETPTPAQGTLRHSMHKYLNNKQSYTTVPPVKKIFRRDSDTDAIHPLSVRAFSPANVKKKAITPTLSAAATQNSLDLELSLKLSPKVYGLPVACLTQNRPNAPSERSFSRSLEDLRDSSTSDGVVGSIGAQGGSFRDGSESDQGLDRLSQCPLPSRLPVSRYLHVSETNLSTCSTHPSNPSCGSYTQEAPRGAFRAVPPRAPPRPPSDIGVARLTGIRPCGIASIDQIINGVARISAARSAHSAASGLNNIGIKSSSVSPTLLNSNNIMGPPSSTTVLKASDQASKNGRHHLHSLPDQHTMHPNEHHSSHRDVRYGCAVNGGVGGNFNGDTHSAYNEGLCAGSASDIFNVSSKISSVIGRQDSSDGVFLRNGGNHDDASQDVQPSTQEEYSLESDLDEQGDGGDKKWSRKHSLPRQYQRGQDLAGRTASDQEGPESGRSSECGPSDGSAGDRVQAWATSFEKLLEDPAGLHTFAEFLKKEYSHENIYFWTACERYRLGAGGDVSPPPITNTPNTNTTTATTTNGVSGGGGGGGRPWGEWPERQTAAATIYNTHLGNNAPEPVNVDSQARQVAQEGLHRPTQELFAAAQKQVFNLMKFDSYSRFLKSGLYQECLERDSRGDCLQFSGEESLDPNLRIHPVAPAPEQQNNNFVKGGKTELEERRRRSLLPWHRNKGRSKSKDRLHSNDLTASSSRLPAVSGKRSATVSAGGSGNSMTKGKMSHVGRLGNRAPALGDSSNFRSNSTSRAPASRHPSDSSSSLGRASEASGSRTSLNSGSEGMLLMAGRKAISKESLTSSECLSLSGCESSGSSGPTGRCRVVLPDRSQSVVAVRTGVTVERVMRRLLDRRGLPFVAFNVMQYKGDKLIPNEEDSSVLFGAEVRIQQLVLFRLDLPNQKTVCVKAKPHKMSSDVLRPILAKYGFKLDLMHIHTIDDPRLINVKGPITELDGLRFIVQTKEDVKEWGASVCGGRISNSAPTNEADALDAITNRVFEDLLHGKTSHQLLTNCDYDTRSTKTDQGSDHSGGVRAALSRRSLRPDKSRGQDCLGATRVGGAAGGGRCPGGATDTPTKDNDELYEGLKRAQMSRIEDQRGTEINSELPDFLKRDSESKENLVEMEDSEDLEKCFSGGVSYLPGATGGSRGGAHFYTNGQADAQHFFSHHYHYQPPPTNSGTTTAPPAPPSADHQHYLHSSNSTDNIITSTVASPPPQPQQHSSSSLTQHQAHHNFWSDISGGGSSIPSSLLATSSSSLSSSTGLPMSSNNNNFEGIDTPLIVASSLLDMQYSGSVEMPVMTQKLRPRPESCVNTRSEVLTRLDQINRPKSSCGSLTVCNSNNSSPDRTLLASPDLDETISANNRMDTQEDRYTDLGSFNNPEDSCRQSSRLGNQTRLPQHLHHRHQHHHMHYHQATIDSIMYQSVSSTNAPSLTVSAANTVASGNGNNFNASGHTNGVVRNGVSSTTSSSFGSTLCGNFGTPPPPLPPKPKLGVPPRGAPPRPPSRQLPLALSNCLNFANGLASADGMVTDDAEQERPDNVAAAAAPTSTKDEDSISFV